MNYCVTDFRRTPVRLQICSLQFALCSTAFFALFSGLAIGEHISLTSRKEKDKVLVIVQDSGCGMDAETCRRVFEKFYQGDTSHASEGNGLGMALAKKIVDIAGGRIWVESSPGKGSKFTVELNI